MKIDLLKEAGGGCRRTYGSSMCRGLEFFVNIVIMRIDYTKKIIQIKL